MLYWNPCNSEGCYNEVDLYIYSKSEIYSGIHFFFLFLLSNIDYSYSLEPSGGSSVYLWSMFWAKIRKYHNFSFENDQFSTTEIRNLYCMGVLS